jgi:hypothetical protein
MNGSAVRRESVENFNLNAGFENQLRLMRQIANNTKDVNAKKIISELKLAKIRQKTLNETQNKKPAQMQVFNFQ